MKLIEKLKKEHHSEGWLDPEACEACASYEAGFRKALELACDLLYGETLDPTGFIEKAIQKLADQ